MLEGAFHGRTMGSLSATPGLSINESFAPYLPGFRAVPRDDADALARGGRRADRRGHARADPGGDRGARRPRRDDRRGSGSVRRGRRPAGLRRDPDRHGQDRLALGLRAAARPARRDDHRQGARGRPAGGRLRHHAGDVGRPGARRPRLDLRGWTADRRGLAGRVRRDRRPGAAPPRAGSGGPADRGPRARSMRSARSAGAG